MGSHNLILLLLIQVGLIVALSRLMGALFARMRQPQVIGEMVAGIMLGPSLFGWRWPALHRQLFPPESVELLNSLSQFGVIFFLFLVGLDLDPRLLKSRGRAALVIAGSSIVVPFALGAVLTVFMFNWGGTFDASSQKGGMLAPALFMGAAMSITAFPVLARILTERRLHKTEVGAVSIACAAVNDLAAWVILAFVVAVAHAAGPTGAARTALLSGAYIAGMYLLVRPFLRRLELVYERQGRLSQGVVAAIFLMVLASAAITEAVGIHAMFGAFLLGFVMPKGTDFVRHLAEKLEDFVVVLLLPIFFAYAGLRTKLGLLNDPALWGQAAMVIAVACLGKFGGTAVAARAMGSRWREASAMGVLMNTRGLMELVILTVGLQLGVINETVFTIMVLMALFTTFATTPLLYWVYPARLLEPVTDEAGLGAREGLRVLVPVADPRTATALLRLADAITGLGGAGRLIYALHLQRPVWRDAYSGAVRQEADGRPAPAPTTGPAGAGGSSLDAVLAYARANDVPVEPISFVSRDVAADIARVVRAKRVDLVLMGFHKPVFTRTILGGTVHRVMTGAEADVAVFVDRGLTTATRILVPYMGGRHDRLALTLAARLASGGDAAVTVLHVVAPGGETEGQARDAVTRVFDNTANPRPAELRVVTEGSPVAAVLGAAGDFDLVVVGVSDEWGLESHLFGLRPERIAQRSPASLLIVRAHEEIILPDPAARDTSPRADAETRATLQPEQSST
jgi:Kef-type K+ transport system membrane component KefB/nucleotide-binding universal stress UspA family protein